ncbi:1-acyl-sn-glycerol-3-phosphate acyltransferase [Bacillus sp. RG28]|uniref:1-acyl-sn-glycerol-3-phosphate acyltransferase n=1 Tax=Gottfriedia endophytica TaxID=2820819 RepID=A0A940NNK6_9BACI|nr:lysophospholipid acyltransferase family protein [Gottfriedia endophytica]MBP0724087.1 1-acyl-sn-glycerol-3-phosphate acyltransferase [Gottfriedia endophytica]
MIRTIYAAIRIIWGVIYVGLKLPKVKRLPNTLSVNERDKFIHQVPDYFGKMMIGVTGSKVEVIGLENIPKDQAVLFVSNHQSNFDIPLLMGYLNKPMGFISKVELSKIPIVRQWMENMNCVFMDREDRRQSLLAIKDGITKLQNGHSLVIFPEGTRSKGDKMGEFKSGSFHLALKSGVPIVPLRINGTYNILESNGNRIKPANISLEAFPPVNPAELGLTDPKAISSYVQQIIEGK